MNVATMHTAASVFMKIIRHIWVACVCICLLLISVVFSNEQLSDWYTQCGSKVIGMIFFLNQRHILFFLFKIKSIGIYTGFCAVVQFLKSCQKFLFLELLTTSWISATSAKWSPFTSFSTWGTENSLAEINLESTGLIKGCNIFWGKKLANLQLCGQVHYHATRKNLESRMQLNKPIERASGGDPLLLHKILHLLFFPLVQILCALYLESRKNYQHGLDAGPLEFQFFRTSECFTNLFRDVAFFRVIGKTPGLIACNNFVKKIFVCIGHRDNVLARRDSIFPLLRCQGVWDKTCTQLSPSQILFQNLKNYSLWDVKRFCYHSWCNSMVLLTNQ